MRKSKKSIYQYGFYLLLGIVIGFILSNFMVKHNCNIIKEVQVDTVKVKEPVDTIKEELCIKGFQKQLSKIEVKPKTTLKKEIKKEVAILFNKDSNYTTLSDEAVLAELHKQGLEHPQIVLKQAKLETGNYTSKVCKTHNNLFGLRKGNSYRRYSSWQESVTAYKELIQSRYKGGDYYQFLQRIGYAEDKQYKYKLQKI